MYTDIVIMVLMAFFAFGAVATITTIGKSRKPLTPGMAATLVLIDIGIICALMLALGVSS